jgi:hypothetical protein
MRSAGTMTTREEALEKKKPLTTTFDREKP